MWRLAVLALAFGAVALPAAVAETASPVLAYEAPDGIHLVRADGSADRLVRGSIEGDQNPKWSPDGEWLVVAHALDGMHGPLFVLDVTTGTRTRVAGASGATPVWTPDGSSIVFETGDQLYSVPSAGGDLSAVTDQDAYEPAFGPDGTLAFAGYDRRDRPALLTAESREASLLVTHGDAWSPAWWPDGNALAFDTDGDYADGSYHDWAAEIHRIGRDGTGEQRLTHNRVWDGTPQVSPDGAQIAFETGRFGWLEIAVMNADGSHPRRVTRELHGDACCADWQPSP